MKLFFVAFISFLILAACKNDDRFKIAEVSQQIRKEYKAQIIGVEKINFDKLIGRTPSPKELELGRFLFNDPILSRNNDTSCATCHLTNHGFADGNSLNVGTMGSGGANGSNVGKKFAEGTLSIDRTLGQDSHGFNAPSFFFRNSMTTYNVAYRINEALDMGLFHDSRFGRIHFQALLPIHTGIELCGTNPIVLNDEGKNIFEEGGPLFDTPVEINHSNSHDEYTGQDTGLFHAQKEIVKGIPYRRNDGSISIPNRNECLAILVAKLRKIPYYKKAFKEVYQDDVTDLNIGKAISNFILTHVANNTPYDRFEKGDDHALTKSQLKGLVMFLSPPKKEILVGKEKVTGLGCANCHTPGQFGGSGHASLGVRSDPRSPLSLKGHTSGRDAGFFSRPRVQRGYIPNCHIDGTSAIATSYYVPDIGRAGGSFDSNDCFKFKIPMLRNVIETYPFFHHGTEKALGHSEKDIKKRSLLALKNVIEYHLRGPINPKLVASHNITKPFFDDLYQKDFLIPYYAQNFIDHKLNDPNHFDVFPIIISEKEKEYIVDFVANGLWDQKASEKGALDNDISHPQKVPSGLSPSITRDEGSQTELPPAFSL